MALVFDVQFMATMISVIISNSLELNQIKFVSALWYFSISTEYLLWLLLCTYHLRQI